MRTRTGMSFNVVGLRSMEISYRQTAPDTVVVTIAGTVMMGSESEQITALVSDLLRAAHRVIVFDLGGVTKIDSTGIGRFIASYNQIAAAGGEMRMAGVAGFVFQAFHVCRLDTVFRFYATVDEACIAQ
jgi:anti-sigma B factor antagonist